MEILFVIWINVIHMYIHRKQITFNQNFGSKKHVNHLNLEQVWKTQNENQSDNLPWYSRLRKAELGLSTGDLGPPSM